MAYGLSGRNRLRWLRIFPVRYWVSHTTVRRMLVMSEKPMMLTVVDSTL
jgi:hypothetical protein